MTTYYKDLEIWKETYAIVIDIYRITEDFPQNEEHNMVSQMRRAATSMPSNIAEGASSLFDRNFVSHLSIAYASGKELETFLMLAKDIGYLNNNEFEKIYLKLDRANSKMFNFMKKSELRLDAKKKGPMFSEMLSLKTKSKFRY